MKNKEVATMLSCNNRNKRKRKPIVAYVVDSHKRPMMPCRSHGRVRRWLKEGKAVVLKRVPFTVMLTKEPSGRYMDDLYLGVDPGRTNIGVCVINIYGEILFASDVQTRNKEIVKLMCRRKMFRQHSRRGERKRRQRRAVKCDSSGEAKNTEYWRMLPGYKKPVCCKVIRNTEARFNHRKNKKEQLTNASARHLLQTHINLVRLICRLLPIYAVCVEVNKFNFQKMENPKIRNWEYQKGILFGKGNLNDAVYDMQHGKCLLCGNKEIQHYHHIIPKSEGGSDSIANIAGLCEACHEGEKGVHKSNASDTKLKNLKKGQLKKYGALSVVNQIIPFLLDELSGMLPLYITTGHATKQTRESCGLVKDHWVDAWCIALVPFDGIAQQYVLDGSLHKIVQYRRQDRAIIKATSERTYYMNGEKVCQNRHKRCHQKTDSLAEFRSKHPDLVCKLAVKPSARRYNNVNRIMPGAAFLYNGKRYILKGQGTNGTKWFAYGEKDYFPKRKCTMLNQNTGFVFIA